MKSVRQNQTALGLEHDNSPLLAGDSVSERAKSTFNNKKNSVPVTNTNTPQMGPLKDEHSLGSNYQMPPPADETYYVENKTNKLIDFNAQLQALKKRTENNLPFTLTQVEDCMYLDQYNILALEYHYYQNDCKYTHLAQCDEHINDQGIWLDSDEKKVTHLLGTEKYQLPGEEIHPMSSFAREDILNFVDTHEDILQRQRSLKNAEFMTVVDQEDTEMSEEAKQKSMKMAVRGKQASDREKPMVEAILAIYKVSQLGGMQRSHQCNVKMGRKYFPAKNGNMMLTRSKDKKVISLVNFDRDSEKGEYFRVLAWTNKLKMFSPTDHFEILNSGLNNYFQSVYETFEELIEVSFVGNSKFVQLVYLEAQPRSLAEQQLYEQAIEKNEHGMGQNKLRESGKFQNFTRRQSPRKARKYVFFEVATGQIVFDYGGVKEQFKAINSNGNEIEVFEMGCLIKEIREEAFNPQVIFFFCGDFMDQQIKEQQIVFKWAMNTVQISMKQIFDLESNEEKNDFVQQHIRACIASNQIDGYLNYYPFDNTWIQNQQFNWEQNIIPSATRKFDQFALLSLSGDHSETMQSTFYVNGPRYKDMMKVSSLKSQNYILDVPYFAKLPNDAVVRHTRNSNIKDQIFYDVVKNNEKKTYCLRLDHQDNKSKVVSIKIPVNNYTSTPDVWLHYKKNFKTNCIDEIFQSIHVTKGDQTAVLQTKLPKSHRNINSSDTDDIVERKTSTFYQIESDSPCICYNLGDSKIVLQNSLQLDNKRKYIVKMPRDEKFVCFVNFNQFEDIGFYPVGLRIECCSHFAYLTTGKGNYAGNIQYNRLNLCLIDPFYEETQVALFKSSTLYDNEIFNEGDTIIQSVIQSTMGKKRDLKFKTCIWTQYPQNLVRSTMMRMNTNQSIEPQDSDEDDESEAEDDDDLNGKRTFEQVRLVLNNRDFIYYITKQNGKCYIMEGNPRDQKIKKHEAIYTLKAERCLAFDIDGPDVFYFMDETHLVYKLSRNENNRSLSFEKELTMKEIQRLDFTPKAFDSVIMNDKYAIQGSKIFYLYDAGDEPFPEGIFEAEELVEEDRSRPKFNFSIGPITIKASNRFFNIYQQGKFYSQLKIFQRPDTTRNTLINDFLNWVDMSSFLEDGKILMKIRRRFMVFTSDGEFIDEVEFNDDILQEVEEDKSQPPLTYEKFKEKYNATRVPENLDTAQHKLMRRRVKNPILDFLGKPYEFKPTMPPVPLSQNNKMELIQFSYNNRWFLFLNRMNNKFFVYELCEFGMKIHGMGAQDDSFFDFKEIQAPKKKLTYKFVLRYDLNTSKSHLFQHLFQINIDPIEYYKSNTSQVKIDDNGCVRLSYVENLPFIDKQDQSNDFTQDEGDQEFEVMQCRLIGSIFVPEEGHLYMKIQNFSQIFDFPRDAQIKMAEIIESKKNVLDRKINNIRMVQSRLPKKYFDYSLYENLIEDLLILETRRTDIIYAKIYFDYLVVVYCGQYIKYGFLVPNKKKTKNSRKDVMDFIIQKVNGKSMQEMHAHLSDTTEVIKVIEVLNKNWLQIITKDHEQDIFSIITWDFANNLEQNIFQLGPQNDMLVGQHVVKGLNQKFNYFLNQNYLTDLEYNIPLRQTNVDQNLDLTSVSYNKQLSMIFNFYNQRKVSNDNSKFLGVERACCLYYPLSRMDLLLWQNINVLGEKAELIQQTCTLAQCNLVIDGISLFHYFADNSELIEQISVRYTQEKQNETLGGTDKTLPLQILNPDNNGKTALFLAVESQCPQSFETMVNMLTDFPNQCLSKMMLKSLPLIVSNESSSVINFFELNIFQPPQMQIEQFIPWQDGMDEFIFASHTSIISKHLLLEKLQEEGVIEDIKEKKKKSNIVEVEIGQQLTARQQMLLNKKNLRPFFLDNGSPSDDDQQLKRVQIEALDMDWIFTGDNAKILLSMLASQANNSALTKKSIRIFVDLMWSKYQAAIIKFIFVPYIAYLCVLSCLSGSVCGEFIMILYEDLQDEEVQYKYRILKIKAYVLTSLATSLMICFGSLEMKQMWADGLEYFSDYWNCIDATSLSINTIFLTMCTLSFAFENELFKVETVRTFGAFSCFFMWIKVFYWMRLFSSLAYYVKLIQQTISDSLQFMLMVLIIILSFANFFYVIDRNLITDYQAETRTDRYYDTYTENPIRDVIISVYMMGALGDFDSTIYRVGYNRYFAVAMFLLATFIISVVFMNMLIAIMGETFGQVQEVSEESGLREQVVLIADHAWLLDPKKIFAGQKYIIRVQPSSSSQDVDDLILDKLHNSEATLMKRMNRLQGFIQKRVDSVDMNTRFLLKHQQMSIEGVNRKLKNVEKMIKELSEKKDEDENIPEEEKVERQNNMKKKQQLIEALNAQTSGQNLTVDKVQEVALNWMEIADKDGNGELDYEEFHDFFSKIEGVMVTDDEIRQIFEDFDGSGNGFLSVEEFARAIYQVILADHDEYSDADEYGVESDLEEHSLHSE